jgi:hypothetical protein
VADLVEVVMVVAGTQSVIQALAVTAVQTVAQVVAQAE